MTSINSEKPNTLTVQIAKKCRARSRMLVNIPAVNLKVKESYLTFKLVVQEDVSFGVGSAFNIINSTRVYKHGLLLSDWTDANLANAHQSDLKAEDLKANTPRDVKIPLRHVNPFFRRVETIPGHMLDNLQLEISLEDPTIAFMSKKGMDYEIFDVKLDLVCDLSPPKKTFVHRYTAAYGLTDQSACSKFEISSDIPEATSMLIVVRSKHYANNYCDSFAANKTPLWGINFRLNSDEKIYNNVRELQKYHTTTSISALTIPMEVQLPGRTNLEMVLNYEYGDTERAVSIWVDASLTYLQDGWKKMVSNTF